MRVNTHFQKLASGYLFPEIAKRVKLFSQNNPQANIIRLGIGDVVLPLPNSIRKALHHAVDDMGSTEKFHGYGPEQGYLFLRDKIAQIDYLQKGIEIHSDEIFVSDGSKQDSGNIQELFSDDSIIAVADPVYPVYVDTNVMAGRTGDIQKDGRYEKIVYMPATKSNGFKPQIPHAHVDIIYLCSPNNPTGIVLTHQELKQWVDYAKNEKALILFDAAYEAFITDPSLPRSIYEVEGARDVAIEFRSFSKNAGFTGTRCAFTIIPKNLTGYNASNEQISLHAMWSRRHATKYNGTPYIIQRAAEAVYSEEGQKETQALVQYYLTNAQVILNALKGMGLECYGGENAPYIWFKTPNQISSWDMFDKLLNEAQVVGTPGAGFGPSGEGYFRISAFAMRDQVELALSRIKANLQISSTV